MRGRAVASARCIARLCLAVLWIAAPAAADPAPAEEPAPDELERVFEHYRRPERAPVVLVIDGAEAATEEPLLLELARPDHPPLVPAAPIVAALAPRLAAEVGSRLRAAVHEGRLSLDALRAIGLVAEYDPRRLELRIEVPARLTRTVSHDLGTGAPAAAAEALPPSDVSGYVNLRAGGTTYPSYQLHTDSAVNLLSWVLEGRGDLAIHVPGAAGPVVAHRGDVLLSRDAPSVAVRFTAGDFAVPTAGLQPGYPVLGVGAGRNFSLQPYRVVRPIGTYDFVLERDSRVTVLVNGAPVQSLALAAGRHDVRDLPLGAGLNDIELVIRDDTGRERRIAFSMASPDALLAPGLSQFSLDLGFPLLADAGLRTYDLEHPILSGRYRQGATSWLTVGGSLDGDLDRQLGGGNVTVATGLGNLSVDAARSHTRGIGDGAAAGARYDYSRSASGGVSVLAITGHYYSPRFRIFGPEMLSGRSRGDVAIATSRKLPRGLLGRLDVRWASGRGVPDAQSLSLGVTRAFRGVAIDASMILTHNPALRDEARLFVTAHWTLSGQRGAVHSASRASTVSGISNEITYGTHSKVPPGGLASSVTLSQAPAELGVGGNLDYTGYRVTTSVSGRAIFDHAGRSTAETASFEAATALAFVGGRAAWSRPITSSFAMIERHPALRGVPIGINPASGGYAAETGGSGLAVVPNLEAYRLSRLVLDAPMLPAGSSLGPTSYVLLPGYRSGTLVPVGQDGTVSVYGILLHYNGESVALAVAELLPLDDRRHPAIPLMTNRAGRFSVNGLKPGHYAVRLSGDARASGELEIPPGTTGVYSARIVEVP